MKKIYDCVTYVLSFLKENGVLNWNDYLEMSEFDKDIIEILIENEVKIENVDKVMFELRLELSTKSELFEFKKELEDIEEYEKCARILKKIKKR